jgi:hypothetical protein
VWGVFIRSGVVNAVIVYSWMRPPSRSYLWITERLAAERGVALSAAGPVFATPPGGYGKPKVPDNEASGASATMDRMQTPEQFLTDPSVSEVSYGAGKVAQYQGRTAGRSSTTCVVVSVVTRAYG